MLKCIKIKTQYFKLNYSRNERMQGTEQTNVMFNWKIKTSNVDFQEKCQFRLQQDNHIGQYNHDS